GVGRGGGPHSVGRGENGYPTEVDSSDATGNESGRIPGDGARCCGPFVIPSEGRERSSFRTRHRQSAYARCVATALALFTRDLRVRDNPVLDSATAGSTSVAP